MTANDFYDRIRFGNLYEIYGELLTQKQKKCMELYFCEDYSLAEIATRMDVSRQAVHDLIKRVEQSLENYEKVLGNMKRFKELMKLSEEAEELVDFLGEKYGNAAASEDNEKIERLNEIVKEIRNESR